MGNAGETNVPRLLEKWAKIALAEGWVERWIEGAIFPSEMVFFLARCEECRITCFVESGRQDGYSTWILGQYARLERGRAYSIDHEADAERAERCREWLKDYPEVNLLTGDATLLLDKVVRKERESPLAILVDGPKGFWAMSLMFACARYKWVKLLSLHNLAHGDATRKYFKSLADEPVFYEEFMSMAPASWQQLKRAEVEFCSMHGGGRSLEHSSLGVMHVTDRVRSRLLSAFHSKFMLYQPRLIHLGWKLGLHKPMSYLFTLSHRFFG